MIVASSVFDPWKRDGRITKRCHDGEAETDQNDDGEYVLEPGDPSIATDRRQAEAGKEGRRQKPR